MCSVLTLNSEGLAKREKDVQCLLTRESLMKRCLLLIALLLVVPMAILNPLGRPAFLGYYAGVIAAWAAYVIALAQHKPLRVPGGCIAD